MPQCSIDAIEDLLRTTRETLLDRVLPTLDPDGRYAVRMAINAIRITERSLNTAEPRQMLMADLRSLYSDCNAASEESLDALQRRFVADIRGGRFDAGRLESVARRLLRDDIERRLRRSNPAYLSNTRVKT